MANITKINVDEIAYKIQGTLYDDFGSNTDGGITQAVVSNELVVWKNALLANATKDYITVSRSSWLKTTENYTGFIVPVDSNKTYKVVSNSSYSTIIIALNSVEIPNHTSEEVECTSFVNGTVESSMLSPNNSTTGIPANTEYSFKPYEGTVCVWIRAFANTANYTPIKFEVAEDTIKNNVNVLNDIVGFEHTINSKPVYGLSDAAAAWTPLRDTDGNLIRLNGVGSIYTIILRVGNGMVYKPNTASFLYEIGYYKDSSTSGQIKVQNVTAGNTGYTINEDVVINYTVTESSDGAYLRIRTRTSKGESVYVTIQKGPTPSSINGKIAELSNETHNEFGKTFTEQRKDDLINLIEKLGDSGSLSTLFEVTRYDGYIPHYDATTNTVTFTSTTDTKYLVYIVPITKGTIFRRTAQATINRTVIIAYTQNEITSGEDLLTTNFDNATREYSSVIDAVSIAPYDGYLMMFFYNEHWVSGSLINYRLDLSTYKDVKVEIEGEEQIVSATRGQLLRVSNGQVSDYAGGWKVTSPIDVDGHYKLKIHVPLTTYDDAYDNLYGGVFYSDAEATQVISSPKHVITLGTTTITGWIELEIPKTAKVFRVQLNNSAVYDNLTTRYCFIEPIDINDAISDINDKIDEIVSERGAQTTTITASKYLDCNSESDTFGQILNATTNIFGVSPFISVEGAKFIILGQIYEAAETQPYYNTTGCIFYDEDKSTVIGSTVTCTGVADTTHVTLTIVSIPNGTKYLRTTLYNNSLSYYLYYDMLPYLVKNLQNKVKELDDNETKYYRQYDKNSQTYNALFTNLSYASNFVADGTINNATLTAIDRVYSDVYYNSVVETKSDSYYKVSYKYMKKGTVIKIYGQSANSTARAVTIGMCTEIPVIDSSITNCFYGSFPQAEPRTLYYTVPFNGYVTIYYYRTSWVSGTAPIITYTDEIGGGGSDAYANLIRQAHYLNYTNTPDTGNAATLGLVHFSDFHEDSEAGNLLMDYVNKYSSYINDVVSTGDVVKNYLDSGSPKTYFNVDGLSNSLFVLGNHDQARYDYRYEYFWTNAMGVKETMEETIAASHEFSFNRYFVNADDDTEATPYHQIWGVTLPNGYDDSTSPYYQSCYWYKDYPDQKVRLIGVDCIYRFDGIVEQDANGEFVRDENNMLKIAVSGEGLAKTTTEQETWIYDRMLDTIDPQNTANGYSIIMMSHYPLDDIVGSTSIVNKEITLSNGNKFTYPCNEGEGMIKNHFTNNNSCFSYYYMPNTSTFNDWFNMKNRIKDSSHTYGYKKGSFNLFGEMINNFMNVEGSIDRSKGKFIAWLCGHTHVDFFYYPKNYPNILNICINQTGNLRDQNLADRPNGTKERLCANYLAINTTSGSLKIVRLGLNMDRNLRPINYTFYDYVNRRIISEG